MDKNLMSQTLKLVPANPHTFPQQVELWHSWRAEGNAIKPDGPEEEQ